ncbi:tetratricopeptide repeat protein [Floridanema aerugineum]|uniref:Tetratricopeptide repeat protein n=1 Tax=Floridaenema aerugineum BLCC-F46 TaxID=3153654 RepID=A0ABV4XDM8_9CYAN
MKAIYLSPFTPSLMMPETLEQIFVQRQNLAEQIIELIRESATTPSKHYTLLIGPRGIGKTHLISLIYHRICKMEDLRDRLLIAWVNEEEWGISSFLDLVVRILKAIEKEYNDSELAKRIESLYQLTVDHAESAAGELLKETIGNRTLLLLIENLDEVFAGLDEQGQKQLRAYLQENSFCTIVATAQSLFNGVKLQTSPFYGFFRIRHLKDLTLDEAVELLAKVAKVQGDRELESFIRTSTGRDRIQAVHYLAGGNPRIYIIFSAFLNRKSLDELVEAFMAMLDDLTPYYQDRMKCLSPQQRKIVDLLCDRRHAVTVKEISQRCFITHQTASSQLKKLLEMGYVNSEFIGRESYYELREPLMRFCLEVKKQRGEPIQLFVDFLRIWYTPKELQQRLKTLPANASLEREYLRHALQKTEIESKDPRVVACLKEFYALIEKHDFPQALQMAKKLVLIRGHADDWSLQGFCEGILGIWDEALASLDKVLELNPSDGKAWSMRGTALAILEHYDEALASIEKAIELDPDDALNWSNQGATLLNLERYDEGLVSFDKAIELDPNSELAWHNRAKALIDLEYYEEALASYDKVIELNPLNPSAWGGRGAILLLLGRFDEALASCEKAIELNPYHASYWRNRGVLLLIFGRYQEALVSYHNVIELNPFDPLAWVDKGEALGELQRYDEALICCDKAIELEPNYADAWFKRGWLLGELGQNEEALASCNKAIELGVQFSPVFFNRAEYLLALNRWDEGIAALDDALNRFVDAEEPDTGDEKAIIRNLFNSTNDATIWRSRIKTLIEPYDKHQVLSALGKGLVESIPTIMSEMVSDKAAQTWLELWREIVGDAKEFEIPLRLLKTAVEYKVKKGDRRVLLELPIEERKLLTEELKIEEAYKK